MADPVIESDQVHSLNVVRELLPWREQLQTGFGTGHGNANLQLIDVLIVMLAGFYNPLIRSQRLLEALSTQRWMQELTGLERSPKSTLSDALDGSYFRTAGEVAWALLSNAGANQIKRDQVRLNLQLQVDAFTPVDCTISGGDNASEPMAFARHLHPGQIYIADRNFCSYAFINAVFAHDCNLVLRLRHNIQLTVQQSLALSPADLEAGVLSDDRVGFRGAGDPSNQDYRSFSDKPPTRPLRRVIVRDQKNQKDVILISDLPDVPARVIAALYRQRWQIELFFKWLKTYANFDHLISHNSAGVTLQFYVAVIATLLLHLATGRRVSKYSLFWLGSVAAGQATFEQMQAGLARIEREKELERLRKQKAAARKKLEA
jgi:hypothetical protein